MNLLDLMIEVGVNDKASSGLDKIVGNVKSTAEKLSAGFKTALDVGTKISTVAAGAMTAITGSALKATGELEQNTGGMAQVFKENAAEMEAIAKTAYTNMGLSASGFMGTANQIGALLQGSGFGIAESATLAADVMQRASDVASIMGIDISRAMESITGAAKGNFTMMDNLGVAINDNTIAQYALSKGITTSTREMTTQQKVGLAMELFMEKSAYAAGNYARENATLAGSFTTAGAAMRNFLSGAGSASAVAASFSNAAKVMVKSLQEIIPRLTDGLREIAEQLAPEIPVIFETALPAIVEGAKSILDGVTKTLPDLARIVLDSIPTMVSAVGEVGRSLVVAIQEVAKTLVISFTGMLYEFTGIDISPLLKPLQDVAGLIRDTLGGMLKGIDLKSVGSVVNGFLTTIAGAITTVVTAMQGDSFRNFVTTLIDMLKTIGGSLANTLKPAANGIKDLFKAFLSGDTGVINSVADAIGNFAKWFEEDIAPIVEGVATGVTNLIAAFVEGAAPIIKDIADALSGLFAYFTQGEAEASKTIADSVVRLFGAFTEGLGEIIENIGKSFKNFVDDLTAKKGEFSPIVDLVERFGKAFADGALAIVDVGVKFSELLTTLTSNESDFSDVMGKIGEVIGAAGEAGSKKWNPLLATINAVTTGIAALDEALGDTSNVGQIKKFFNGTWFPDMVDFINEFGEGAWALGEGYVRGDEWKENRDFAREPRTAYVPYENTSVAKSDAAVANTIIHSMPSTPLSDSNTEVVMQLSGHEVGRALLPYLQNVIRQTGVAGSSGITVSPTYKP